MGMALLKKIKNWGKPGITLIYFSYFCSDSKKRFLLTHDGRPIRSLFRS